ncbi:unnamed protein product [Paramecium pentaurelia]|uniref:Uncharacterized protein n=1 Tax=Paramecium pentaurelia TaxID=43138 RepID=A0A8S1X4U5_9CILI|nr:unnamed protein product [Paramecium pentaurelia]
MKWEIVRLAIRKKRNLEYLLLNFEIYLFILINHIISLVKDGFPGCGVYLRVLAQEKCKWTETSTSTSTDSESNTSISTTTYTYTGKSYIYQHKLELHNFESPLLPLGQFVFPFQFQLFSYLLGSYYEKDLAQISCFIQEILLQFYYQQTTINHKRTNTIKQKTFEWSNVGSFSGLLFSK